MHELRQMLKAVDSLAKGERAYLATVVDVVGSAYRRPGAKMLVLPAGERIGSISGGCLEKDLCRAAPELCRAGPRLVCFDTRQESIDFNPRYNLGCSGITYVLVEAISADESSIFQQIKEVLSCERSQVIARVYVSDEETVFASHLFRLGACLTPNQLDSDALAELAQLMQEVEQTGVPICCDLMHVSEPSRHARMMIERLDPPKPLWVFGAGDDAQALVSMAAELGWDVTVYSSRSDALSKIRFPRAKRRVVGPLSDVANLSADEIRVERVAAILMTHDLDADAGLLPKLLDMGVSYIGVLGPKARTGVMMKQLQVSGQLPALAQLDRLHTPVGLDIGAKTGAEVAVAILAEIIAEDNQRSGGRLADRAKPIHEPVDHRVIEIDPSLILP